MERIAESAPRRRTWSERLYRPFVYEALGITLTLGFATGAGMLLLPVFRPPDGITWRTHTQAHSVAQAMGWAGLFVMGIAYHVVPRFRNTAMPFVRPQYLSLVLVLAGVSFRFFGQSFHSWEYSDLLLQVSAVELIAGAVLFVGLTAWTLRQGNTDHGQVEWWVWTGLAWLVVSVLTHAWIVADMIDRDSPIASARLGEAIAHASLVGFIGNFVLGVSSRTLTGFMILRPQRPILGRLPFVTLNEGVAMYVSGTLAKSADLWMLVATALELIGFVAFILALRLAEPKVETRRNITQTYMRREWFIKAAYAWLMLWAVLQVVEKGSVLLGSGVLRAVVAAPLLHVLGLGFVTMMILGLAGRMLPIFEGAFLPHQRLMDAAFIMLNLSVGLRLTFGIVRTPASTAILGASGLLGLTALVLFGWVVWGVFRPAARERYRVAMQSLALANVDLVKLPRHPRGDQA